MLALLSMPAPAHADGFGRGGPFALGIVVGEPTGVSGLDMYHRSAPIDVFFELALATNLLRYSDPCDAPDYYCGYRAWLEGSLGARYSF